MTLHKPFLILVLPLTLAACVGPARMDAPVNDDWRERSEVLEALTLWEFTGRIGVRDDRESHSSRIRWRQRGEEYTINLWGTLNAGATEISGVPGHVVLLQEGETPLTADSPEQLVYEQLGYELPVSQLSYWIKGIPAPGESSAPAFNAENHLVSLEQSGWQVQYLGYTNYETESLPTRIRMEKAPLRLDFVRLDWTLQP
ncbi:MAG: lipoprotein insertase outer membrane protein LolB [Gammaproteobacteria bacterium]|nr:lipoprotein insertase outer membrane protein LolB [Gammaproteobacteria bacterium]MDP2142308.1 lipoprotein insertase outer membrane protein LolB [Gammaproteobacteria bacterium]MDP2348549.1 lipoprotein insertase outer membrane protein LolB [Gammaproteobacteria bacterium]